MANRKRNVRLRFDLTDKKKNYLKEKRKNVEQKA